MYVCALYPFTTSSQNNNFILINISKNMQQTVASLNFSSFDRYETPLKQVKLLESPPLSVLKEERKADHPKPCLSDQSLKDVSYKMSPASECPTRMTASEITIGMWPQISVVVRKISILEERLAEECRFNFELTKNITKLEEKIKEYEQIVQQQASSGGKNKETEHSLSIKIVQLEKQLEEKDSIISEEKQTISNLQVQHISKIGELENKLKKAGNDHKELSQKLRKANTELRNQKKINQDIKNEMASKIQNLQSDKEKYLTIQVEQLKSSLQSTRDQRENHLIMQISDLREKIFKLEEQLRIAYIRINLNERKKQQAVTEAIEKKEQEVKVQKLLSKTLNEKIAKMQEQKKNLLKKKDGPQQKKKGESPRVNRTMQPGGRQVEEEVCFELSP